MRAGEVHRVSLGRRDEAADLLEPLRRQPALAPPALHGEAVGRLLVRAAESSDLALEYDNVRFSLGLGVEW